MFHTLWNKNRFIKYFGVIGIFGPIVIFVYYTYIESWLLGYSYFALTGAYEACTGPEAMSAFLNGYRGVASNAYFSGIGTAYLFFAVTFALNILIVYFGIRRGIEKVCLVSLPLLFLVAVVLVVRVLALGTPDPARPGWNVSNGLGFLWNPDWSALASGKVWLAAAGQIFFTLSVGIGVILTYASYLTDRDDVALSGLSAASANELVEVILGGTLVIPAAFAFFGPEGTMKVAGSVFDLAFVTMPLVLQKLAYGHLFGFLWFLLLFVAGLTSSISLVQPAVAFLEDEFGLSRRSAILAFSAVAFAMTQACIFGLARGVVDEFDFWGGNFCLVLFGTVEAILFAWVFGMEGAWKDLVSGDGSPGSRLRRFLVRHNSMEEAWTQLHVGSDITIPRIYRFIIKYVTPLFLLVILGAWFWQEGLKTIFMQGVKAENFWAILGTRAMLLALFVGLAILVKMLWRRRRRAEGLAP
jgi:SNF family Na+-dependent transporter